MKNIIKEFVFALTFLTRIPVYFQIDYDDELPGKSMLFYPLIGAIIGLLVILVGYISNLFVSHGISSILSLITLIYLSGGLHLDGFMDTVDGVLGGTNAERMREIMHDSQIGAFGVIALFLLLMLKFNLILELQGLLRWQLLFLMPILSRFVLPGITYYFPLAVSSKLGQSFKSGLNKRELGGCCFWLILFYIILVNIFTFSLSNLIFITIISILVSLLTAYYIFAKIGGLTGDSYGTVLEIVEITVLFTGLIVAKI